MTLRIECRLAAIMAALAGVMLGSSARAQERTDPIETRIRHRPASPQHFAAEVRFAPFSPDIDSDPALHGATPYKTSFGTPSRLLISAEFDWQALRIPHFGSVGPGLGVGYVSMTRPAAFVQPHGTTTVSSEDTTLQIFPVYAVIVARADVFWREGHVPLIPYAKAGLGVGFWRASNTLGTSRVNGLIGEGDSVGTHFALGLALSLNPFDPYAAAAFDDSTGVNDACLFAEWTREDLDGLGVQSHPLRVGGTSWTFGLALEF